MPIWSPKFQDFAYFLKNLFQHFEIISVFRWKALTSGESPIFQVEATYFRCKPLNLCGSPIFPVEAPYFRCKPHISYKSPMFRVEAQGQYFRWKPNISDGVPWLAECGRCTSLYQSSFVHLLTCQSQFAHFSTPCLKKLTHCPRLISPQNNFRVFQD